MNDTELDEMLNQWEVPPVRPVLQQSVRARFAAIRKPKADVGVLARWIARFVPGAGKGLFAAAVVGAIVCLFVVTQAFPQALRLGSFGFRIPYTVEYDLVKYATDGSLSFESHITEFKNGGDLIILWKTDSNQPFPEFDPGSHEFPVRMVLLQVAPSLVIPRESGDRAAWKSCFRR